MEDKYYVPRIEEFHIGFLYEEYIAGSGDNYSIVSFDYDHWKFVTAVYDQKLQEGWIRCKYLDKEDIESLGFWEDYDDDEGNVWYRFEKDEDYRLCFNNELQRSIWMIDSKLGDAGADDAIFRGKIKNKSELKILLKQLEIR